MNEMPGHKEPPAEMLAQLAALETKPLEPDNSPPPAPLEIPEGGMICTGESLRAWEVALENMHGGPIGVQQAMLAAGIITETAK